MPRKSHPELDGERYQTLYTLEFKRTGQLHRERLSWVILGLLLGTGTAAALWFLVKPPLDLSWPRLGLQASAMDDGFTNGVSHAMKAAELTQEAKAREEWIKVALLWQQAISAMQSVPPNHRQYDLAQQKVEEYTRNRQYAETNVRTRVANTSHHRPYWTVGSDRDWVIAVQGSPSRTLTYNGSCHEVLRYGSSTIELKNGYVHQYSNLEGNLKVLASTPIALSTQGTATRWSLGSSADQVLKLQGTPSRTQQYGSGDLVTFYYGNSSVVLDRGHVISYWNTDQNLKVSVNLTSPVNKVIKPNRWSVGSSRAEVLSIQPGPPQAVSRNDNSCEEVLHFGGSEVVLRQGFVSGYKNEADNLLVR